MVSHGKGNGVYLRCGCGVVVSRAHSYVLGNWATATHVKVGSSVSRNCWALARTCISQPSSCATDPSQLKE